MVWGAVTVGPKWDSLTWLHRISPSYSLACYPFLSLLWTDLSLCFELLNLRQYKASEEKLGLLHTVSCDGDCSRPYPFTFLTGAFPLHCFPHCHDFPLPEVFTQTCECASAPKT